MIDLNKLWSKVPKNFPKEGWKWVGSNDYGTFFNEDGTHNVRYGRLCHLCGRRLRYGHSIRHKDWCEDIIVGKLCAAYAKCLSSDDLQEVYHAEHELRGKKKIHTKEEQEIINAQSEERLTALEIQSLETEAKKVIKQQKDLSVFDETLEIIRECYFSRFNFINKIQGIIEAEKKLWTRRNLWTLTGNRVNYKREFDLGFFCANVVLFKKDKGWKCVLHTPRQKGDNFGRHWHETAMYAADEAYQRFRTAIVDVMNRSTDANIYYDSFRVDCLQWLIRNKIPHEFQQTFNQTLYNNGIDL